MPARTRRSCVSVTVRRYLRDCNGYTIAYRKLRVFSDKNGERKPDFLGRSTTCKSKCLRRSVNASWPYLRAKSLCCGPNMACERRSDCSAGRKMADVALPSADLTADAIPERTNRLVFLSCENCLKHPLSATRARTAQTRNSSVALLPAVVRSALQRGFPVQQSRLHDQSTRRHDTLAHCPASQDQLSNARRATRTKRANVLHNY